MHALEPLYQGGCLRFRVYMKGVIIRKMMIDFITDEINLEFISNKNSNLHIGKDDIMYFEM